MTKLKVVTGSDPGLSPPRPLGTHGQALWTRVLSEFAVDDVAGREMLAHACASLDTAELCADQVRADGPVIRLKGGAIREHPALRLSSRTAHLLSGHGPALGSVMSL